MKKWMVIGLSSSIIIVWISFFFVLLGKETPQLAGQQHAISVREKVVLSKNLRIFETTHLINEDPNTNINLTDQQTIDTTNVLYDFEQGNSVSIDELLSALNIETE
ncbi:hypothetical protein GCM10011351_10230 [Paraliobacillus quinghaiensis]|uniref:Uncharacterized protein n=1 Tax=Paraliobacillus quinghaiensis TaxID=470815 RepID=A0A917WT45_9BACI|nr:hypothetical protein [Paraliobacillus quinghaiensis]GGM26490.1 hypothetical protein GCM10011351_10230 [Paraliobacillus quinghaiensis]